MDRSLPSIHLDREAPELTWKIDFIFHICEQHAPKAKNGNVTKSPDKATVQPLQNILKSRLS